MNTAEKLTAIAENEQKVYESGQDNERLRLWNAITNYGKRGSYAYAFQYADFSDVEFIKTVEVGLNAPTTASASYMFRYYRGKRLPKNIMLRNIPEGVTHSEIFFKSDLEQIENIGIPALNAYHNTFYGCSKLKSISLIVCHRETTFFQTFDGCSSLESVNFLGSIGRDISFSTCANLSVASIKNIILGLVDYANTEEEFVYTLTLNGTSVSNLEKEGATSPNGNTWRQYAMDKGWNIS